MNIITSGIKNALERGESIEQVIQSFRNAGYNEEDIAKSVEEIRGWNQYNSQNSSNTKTTENVSEVKEEKSVDGYKRLPGMNSFEAKNKMDYLPYILIVLLGLLVIGGAAILGLYWNRLF